MDIQALKQRVLQEVDAKRDELVAMSRQIHANPELGFQEYKASALLTNYLEQQGFTVERGIAQLHTAFKAVYGSDKPVIAFCAEYDALPQLGHACGHNLIACAAVGAGLAAKAIQRETGGTFIVYGCPAEEIEGGKAYMVNRDAFQGIDAAMIVHPGVRNTVIAFALARVGLDVEFFGKPAHAAARPHDGINALDAMVMAFNGINALRQQKRDRARVHGIITDGGEAANTIPAHTAGTFMVRAEDNEYLEVLQDRVLNCFKAAAQATGCRLEYQWAEVAYDAMRTNVALAGAFAENLKALGREIHPPDASRGMGSTDMGNVSAVAPAIHPSIAIAPEEVAGHSPEFREASITEEAWLGLTDGAKAMAMTAIDLILQPGLLEKVKEEFKKKA